jgi:hypothetical protein
MSVPAAVPRLVPPRCPAVPPRGTNQRLTCSEHVPPVDHSDQHGLLTILSRRGVPLSRPAGIFVVSPVQGCPAAYVPLSRDNSRTSKSRVPRPYHPKGVGRGTVGVFREMDLEKKKGNTPNMIKEETQTGWDPHKGERLGPAWDRILHELSHGEWQSWASLVEAVAPESGLVSKSVDNLIYNGIRHGFLMRRGRVNRRSKTDNRSVRLSPQADNG